MICTKVVTYLETTLKIKFGAKDFCSSLTLTKVTIDFKTVQIFAKNCSLEKSYGLKKY